MIRQSATLRRERRYLQKVKAALLQIHRQARVLAQPQADVTPTDMHMIMIDARRGLRALGWDIPLPEPEPFIDPTASQGEPDHD